MNTEKKSKLYPKPTQMASELTLLGLFAKDAMMGLLANPDTHCQLLSVCTISEQSFEIANKMVELLNKK